MKYIYLSWVTIIGWMILDCIRYQRREIVRGTGTVVERSTWLWWRWRGRGNRCAREIQQRRRWREKKMMNHQQPTSGDVIKMETQIAQVNGVCVCVWLWPTPSPAVEDEQKYESPFIVASRMATTTTTMAATANIKTIIIAKWEIVHTPRVSERKEIQTPNISPSIEQQRIKRSEKKRTPCCSPLFHTLYSHYSPDWCMQREEKWFEWNKKLYFTLDTVDGELCLRRSRHRRINSLLYITKHNRMVRLMENRLNKRSTFIVHINIIMFVVVDDDDYGTKA